MLSPPPHDFEHRTVKGSEESRSISWLSSDWVNVVHGSVLQAILIFVVVFMFILVPLQLYEEYPETNSKVF